MQQNREVVRVEAPEWFEHDAVARRYEALFGMLDWSVVREKADADVKPGRLGHPLSAYIKALLVMQAEKQEYVTEVYRYLCEHPALVWVVGFRVQAEASSPYGFQVEATVPSAGHLRRMLRTLEARVLTELLAGTAAAVREVCPTLGEQVILDVKHIYAHVKENNPRAYVRGRYDPSRQPRGDRDCRLGVKKRTNRQEKDGVRRTEGEYVWGYGTGVAMALTPDG